MNKTYRILLRDKDWLDITEQEFEHLIATDLKISPINLAVFVRENEKVMINLNQIITIEKINIPVNPGATIRPQTPENLKKQAEEARTERVSSLENVLESTQEDASQD